MYIDLLFPTGMTSLTISKKYTPSDNDIVLLNKFYVASTALAGSPMVFCPSEFLDKLDPMGPVRSANRVRFSVRQEKEFLKAVKKLQAAPWRMSRASCYLNTLVANNAAGCAGCCLPPDGSFACDAGQVNCRRSCPSLLLWPRSISSLCVTFLLSLTRHRHL